MLSILTVNTHKGFSWSRRRFALHELRVALRATSADIVFLQEVVGENVAKAGIHPNWPEDPHHKFLAEEHWPHYAYGRNAVYPLGHHGNALLSRFPIAHAEQNDISTNRVEQRGFLYCAVLLPPPAPPLHCICVHLGLLARSRRKQVRMLRAFVRGRIPHDEPLIVAGDFNEWSRRRRRDFAAALGLPAAATGDDGRLVPTFPAWLPVLPLDRIYARGLQVTGTRTYHGGAWARLSDHAGLAAEMELAPDAAGRG